MERISPGNSAVRAEDQHKLIQLQARRAVNTESLIIARERAGLTQTQLAGLTGFSQAKISRFEDGISEPSEQELAAVAAALKVSTQLFFRSDIKRSVFNSFYRKRKSVGQKALMRFNARVCFRQVQIDRLLEKVDTEWQPLPRFDPDDYPGGLKQVATALRQFLKLPPGPVKHLVSPIEDAGVVVVIEDFEIPKLDGISTLSNKKTPIVFLNSQAPASRKRFSLAHEFAHTVLHTYLRPDVDEQADALAAELLMPEDEIHHDLADGPLSVERLAALKLRWRVSMAALLFRAKTLNLIAPRRYSYLWTQMSASGYRIREPHEEYLEDDRPTLERDLIEFHRNELNYSTAEVASSLDENELEIERRFGVETKLRVM